MGHFRQYVYHTIRTRGGCKFAVRDGGLGVDLILSQVAKSAFA
jgi:hypothetical protein